MSETQPAFKKPRVSEDTGQDEGKDLGDSDSAGSGADSEDLDAEEEEEEEEAFRANDMIDLIFIEPDEQEYLAAVPQYTHQFFDVENHLEEVTFMAAPDDCRVSIYVRCSDYKHLIGVPAGSSGQEQQQLHACLKKALPVDAEVFLLHGNNNGDDDEEEEEEDREYLDRIEAFAVQSPAPPPPPPLPPSPAAPAVSPTSSKQAQTGTGIGKHIHTFQQGKDVFKIYLASAKDAGCVELVQRAERVAMWFIETADTVDFRDERWQVLFLYRCCKSYRDEVGRKISGGGQVLSLAGYFTLFTFHNPFAGSKIRVCQCLVLPHLQGRGLGRELLMCTYRLASDLANVTEITVEDPAPGFQSLRDAVDLEWLFCHWPTPLPRAIAGATVAAATVAIKPGDVSIAAAKLKLTPAQVEYLSEAEQYACLQLQAEALGGAESAAGRAFLDTHVKPLRLTVKRRLLRQQPDIKALPKVQMQRELETLYAEQQERFERSCRTRARLLTVTSNST